PRDIHPAIFPGRSRRGPGRSIWATRLCGLGFRICAMYKVTLHHPDIRDQVARFRWSIEPSTALYRECQFHLTFPGDVPIGRIAMALWWRIALICLHSHWNFLRPCTIRLPIQLPRGEVEFWLRLLDAEASTLDTYRGVAMAARQISIIDQGPPLEAP